MKKQLTGSIYLTVAVLIWGSTFVAQSVGMDTIGPFTFQACRCLLAVLFLVPVIAIFEHKDFSSYWKRWADVKLWGSGILCGIALFAAASLQQISLLDTEAGKAGFLTALYVVFVPIIGFFLGKKPAFTIVISIVLAVVGLYLLSCMGVSTIQTGDILLLGSAICFAVQITLIDRLGGNLEGLRLNCIQCFVVGILSTVAMFILEEPDLGNIAVSWFPIAYAGVLSMGVAYSLQILGQQKIEPTAASIIMSLESVVAAVSGALLLHERMSPQELLGCGLVFVAVSLSQIPIKSK